MEKYLQGNEPVAYQMHHDEQLFELLIYIVYDLIIFGPLFLLEIVLPAYHKIDCNPFDSQTLVAFSFSFEDLSTSLLEKNWQAHRILLDLV